MKRESKPTSSLRRADASASMGACLASKSSARGPLYVGNREFPKATTRVARASAPPSSSRTIAEPVCPVAPTTQQLPSDMLHNL